MTMKFIEVALVLTLGSGFSGYAHVSKNSQERSSAKSEEQPSDKIGAQDCCFEIGSENGMIPRQIVCPTVCPILPRES